MASIIRRGKGQFQARIRRKGYSTLVKTFTTRRDALLWVAQVENEMAREVFVAAQPECEKTTLAEALDRYSREVTPHKKGAATELRRINAWKKLPLASCYLANIRGVDMAAYRDARMALGRGGNTIRLELALMSHLFEVARKDWGMETLANPVKAIRKPKLPRGRDRRLQPGEEAKLLEHCDKHNNWRLKAAIQLAIETAMRRSELTQLKWDDINLQTRLLHLADTKNGESRTVPLSTRSGLNRLYCRRHEEHFERHGSHTKASYRAEVLTRYRQAAQRWLEMNADNAVVRHASTAIEVLYRNAGPRVEAFRLAGLTPEQRARVRCTSGLETGAAGT